MDGTRFDALAKGLASARSRRGVVKGLGAALLGAAGLARFGGAEAKPACRGAGHPCEGNQTCCGDLVCVASGPGAAKRCTASCSDEQVMFKGACCTPATTCPDGACGSISDGCGGTLNCSCGGGNTCCGNNCIDTASDPSNCGGCGSDHVCPGLGTPYTNVTCSGGECFMSCQGEHYDVNGDPSDGCEAADSPVGNHTQATATVYDPVFCSNGTNTTITGRMVSDKQTHASPAIAGFDLATGSAPDWHYVPAPGGFSCVNDLKATLTIMGSSMPGNCYRLTAITDRIGVSASALTNASGVADVSIGAPAYSDNGWVAFEVSKFCSALSLVESVDYTIVFHL
jgi:hypothetical protein